MQRRWIDMGDNVLFHTFPPSELQAGAKLVLNRQFSDEHWTKNRVVTCLDWSPQVRDDTHVSSHRPPFFSDFDS